MQNISTPRAAQPSAYRLPGAHSRIAANLLASGFGAHIRAAAAVGNSACLVSMAALLLLSAPAYAQESPSRPSQSKDSPRPQDLEPAVNTSAPPPSAMERAVDTSTPPPQSVLEPAVDTSAPADAPAPAQDQKARTTSRSGKAMDRLELDTTQITGNRELPKVLYIVPWKRSDLGDLLGKPVNSLLDEVLTPVDRDVHKRENRYYSALESGTQPDAAQGATAK